MLLLLVNALAPALPAVLVWTTLATCCRRLGGPAAASSLTAWSGAGAIASVGLAVGRNATLSVNNELASLVLLSLMLLLGTWVLARLWRRGRSTAGRPGAFGSRGPASALGSLLVLATLPDILLLTAGIPQPGASAVSSDLVLNGAGYLAGLGVAVVAGWALHRAAAGSSARAVRGATTAVIGVAMVGQATTIVQILLARRLIPVTPWLFGPAAWLINHEAWFTYALMALAAVPAVSAWRLGHARSAGPFANPAEHRLVRADALSRRRFLVLTGTAFAGAVVAGTVGRGFAEAVPTLSPPEELHVAGDDVWVDLRRLDDGHLHRFAYQTASGVEVRFIAVRKRPNAYGVGLDACQICGPAGFYERDGRVTCLRCGVALNVTTIGFKGGCNPIPLQSTIADARLLVARAALERSAPVFA